jgi:DNA-binding IclR family transcriptional regulator
VTITDRIIGLLRIRGTTDLATIARIIGRKNAQTSGFLSSLRRRGVVEKMSKSKSGVNGHTSRWRIRKP